MATRQQTGKATGDEKDGDDLTTILDQSQRAELTLLLAAITDSMRNLLLQTFDADAGLDSPYSRDHMTEEEKLMSADPKSADVEQMDKQKRLKEEYEKDLSSMKMRILKKQSLQAFDDWREQVLVRIGEVVNSRSTVKKQIEATKTTQVAPDTPTTVGKIVEAPDRGTSLKFRDLYPPVKNSLTKLSMEQRTLVLHSVLLLLLSLKHYNAPSRVLLLLLTSSLKLPLKSFEHDEYITAKGLLEGAKQMTAEEEKKKKVEESKDSRKWKVGLATVAGAALIGVTGGLAAPLVAAGVGSVMGGIGLGATSAATYLGSVAGSTYLVGGLFGAYGGRMTGNMMDNYAKEVEDFEFLPIHSNKKTSDNEKEAVKQASDNNHKLRVSICISGWLTEKEEVLKPWHILGTGADVYALKYELEAMLNLGNAMTGFAESYAWGYAKKKLIASSIFAELAAAMWPIGLLKAARVVDNPFQIAKTRSEKAGEVLADALINKAQGERPVTLIGYSLGARVIFTCLMSLAKRNAFGLVENAILVGGPTPSDTSDWRMLRAVVSGRLVNVYSTNDYILGFLYRTSSLQYGIAGLQAVQGLPGVENIDVSDEVSGHLRYRYLMGSILRKIGFEDLDFEAIEREKQALSKTEEEAQKNLLEAQRKRMLRRQSNQGKEDEEAEADQEASEIEKDVKAKTEKSMLTKAWEYFYTPKTPGSTENIAISRNAQGAEKETVKTDVIQPTQSYTSKAAGYLPSLPKSLPSIPGLPGRNRHQQTETVEQNPGSSDNVKVNQRTAHSQANTADNPSRSTTNTRDNTIEKSAGARKQQRLIETTKSTATDQTAEAIPLPEDVEMKATVSKGLTQDKAAQAQSYTDYAASYLPSLPISLPAIPGLSSSKKPSSNLGLRGSGVKSPPPKLERRESGQIKSSSNVPNLGRRTSGLKSPPPKLGPRRISSSMKQSE